MCCVVVACRLWFVVRDAVVVVRCGLFVVRSVWPVVRRCVFVVCCVLLVFVASYLV